VLRLYDYGPSANCYKVRLLLAELGVRYERVPVDIFAGETLNAVYAAKNPALTTPVLELAPGEYLPESNAILLYLAEGTELLPADRVARAQVHRWLFFEQSRVVPMIGGLRFRVLTGRLAPESREAQNLRRIGEAILGVLDAQLEGQEFFVAGAPSVADLCLYGYLHVAHEAELSFEPRPNLAAWLARVRSRPGHVADLLPYPPNARPGESRSIYDLFDV
jgi:glutathione S-transferase